MFTQTPFPASADSASALTDASNCEDDKAPRIAPDDVEESHIYQNSSSFGTLSVAMERSVADSNNLTNNSPSDPVELHSARESRELRESVSEETWDGRLLPPYWTAGYSQGSCLNNDYSGIPSSSPTKHQNGEQVPTTSQVSTMVLVEM